MIRLFLLLLTDYVNGGELFTHLYQREKFTEDEVRLYIGEIVIAIDHLHRVSHPFSILVSVFWTCCMFRGKKIKKSPACMHIYPEKNDKQFRIFF